MGLGEGKGEDQTTNVVAGSCCAMCCGVCFLVIGLPMLIAGVVLVLLYNNENYSAFSDIINSSINEYDTDFPGINDPAAKLWENDTDFPGINDPAAKLWDIMYKVGIAMIVVSVLCVVTGVIMVVLLCTGCFGRNQRAPLLSNSPSGIHVQPSAYVVQRGYNQF